MEIAIDCGYGHVKTLTSGGGRHEFPSIVQPWTADGLADGLRGVVELEGRRVIVGQRAQGGKPLTNDDFHGGFEWRCLLAAALGRVCAEAGRSVLEVDRLGLGLPYAQNRSEVRQRISGVRDLAFSIDGEPHHAVVRSVTVLPQGAAVLAGCECESVGVVDIGYYTIDMVLMIGGELVSAGSWSAPEGAHTVYKRLDRLLNARVGRSGFGFDVLRRVLETWQIRIGGRTVDLTEDVQCVLGDYASTVDRVVRDQWGSQVDLVEKVIVAGGGAELLRGRLPEIYEIHPDPQFANVHGYLAAISA